MKDGLVNENVLFLHLLDLELELGGQLGAINQLRKLDHFAFLDVDSQAARLVQKLGVRDVVSFFLAELGDDIDQGH